MKLPPEMLAALLGTALAGACGDPGGAGSGNELELITTVTLSFAPPAGDRVVAVYEDADGDGGEPPTADAIVLAARTTYELTITFENRLVVPAEDITDEVRDEADEHQVFLTGTAVDGPASDQPDAPLAHTYADVDPNGLPIGLESTIVTRAGVGQLVVTLRHLPPLNDGPQKTATLADDVKSGGFAAIGGDTDASVTFEVMVP